MGKSFTTAAQEVMGEILDLEYPFDFTIDDRVVRYRKPSDGEGLMMTLLGSRHIGRTDQLAGVVDIFARVLEPKDHDYIVSRLLDPQDPFGSKALFGEHGDDGILADMLEEWSGIPT